MTDEPKFLDPKIQFIKALAAAQLKFKPVQRTSKNPFFKSSYAPYEAVWDAVGEELNKNGFAVMHKTAFDGERFVLVTLLMHVGGHEESCMHPVQTDKADNMQSKGSAETYAKRYNLTALTAVPIVDEDDDGNAATGKGSKELAKLTDEQQKDIEKLFAEIGPEQSNFLRWAGVTSTREIPADKYAPSIKVLTSLRKGASNAPRATVARMA